MQAAQALGHTVPEDLVVRAGQLFYRAGALEEVRLTGVLPGTRTDAGDLPRTAWSTPTPPTLQRKFPQAKGAKCLFIASCAFPLLDL